MSRDEFFPWQRRVLGILLGWGLLSMLAGAALATRPSLALRHFGFQALAWGAIDALLALFGRRSAVRKQGDPGVDALAEARTFRTILAANAGLDVGYIAGGRYLLRTANGRPERVGMGWGIVVQGLFLLLYDTGLALTVQRWLATKTE